MHGNLEPVVRNEASDEIVHQHLNASKPRRDLRWTPRFGPEEGLSRTIVWYRESLAA